MSKDFLNDLNPEQQEAVLNTEGPMIILAGAGSGKTRVITHKVIYLLQKGVNPINILCATFTNKAANEMKQRIQKFLHGKSLPTISTFHSLCAKILRIDGRYIDLSEKFVIYDEQDQQEVIKQALEKLGILKKDHKPTAFLAVISEAKNQLITEVEYPNYAQGYFQKLVSQVYPLYQRLLKENEALDFDDLLLKTISLFEKNPEVLKKYQTRFCYILVDEYQDTNHAQYQLTKMLAGKHRNVCVVGDFSQSIYSWRGADFQNLTKFKEEFPEAKAFSLSQNYRSTQKILEAASSVIAKNTTHPVLKLWTENPIGENIIIYEAVSEQDEAKFIANQIISYTLSPKPLAHQGASPAYTLNSLAVLYRTNAQSRVIEEVFLHRGIPYALVGGVRFYERKEIKDILAYLRLLINPKDMVSYKRLEKLGKGRLQKFLKFQDSFKNQEEPTIEILDEIIKKTDYLLLYDKDNEEDRQRLENIKELRSVALEFPNLLNFLENVALVKQEYLPDHPVRNGEKKDVATLMTLHAAKGLEFPVVFMVGMEEGLFPHSRSLFDLHDLEEERRLCYVGMTRAREKLFFTFARRRLFFGQRTANTISRFILELPREVIVTNALRLEGNDNEAPEFL